MNFIQKIIQFLASLFGGKKKNAQPKGSTKTTPRPKPTPKPTPTPQPQPTPRQETPTRTEPQGKKLPEMTITDEVMGQSLHLGYFDKNSNSKEYIEGYLKRCHARANLSEKNTKLRNGDTLSWVDLKPLEGNTVKILQTFLVNTGILPEWAKIDGLFGYGTQAGVRLFQEYERTYGGKSKVVPHGVVDPATWKMMEDWQRNSKKASKWTRGTNSPEFNKWMQILKKGQAHYLKESKSDESKVIINAINKKIDKLNNGRTGEPIDTVKIQNWNLNPKETHVIGVRRNEDKKGTKRINDDSFILLINGMVFKFWGSTDPSAKRADRTDEAFLVEGQHKFRFGWHKKSSQKGLYQGLNPYNGVLVSRDRTSDDSLSQADFEKGKLDLAGDINFHWTGIGIGGRETFSAGCQVIAAKNYIDNNGKEWDCGNAFADNSRKGKEPGENIITTKTKGAYNMFIDLILCFRPKEDVDHVYYTLGREDSLMMDDIVIEGEQDQIVRDSTRVIPGIN